MLCQVLRKAEGAKELISIDKPCVTDNGHDGVTQSNVVGMSLNTNYRCNVGKAKCWHSEVWLH